MPDTLPQVIWRRHVRQGGPRTRVSTVGGLLAARALAVLIGVASGAAGSAAPASAASSRVPGAAQRPGPGGALVIPFPKYDGTLTPYTFELAYPLVTLVYDTLYWRDGSGSPQPWLARSLSSSAGGRTVTVALRPGVRWQDGRPLTAADVAFTYGYVATHFHPRFTPELADVEHVTATGPLTVAFQLRHSSLGFTDQPLSDVPILPQHLWQGLAQGQLAPRGLPVGSGPYRLVSEGRSNGYVLKANHRYFLGAPLVPEIRVPIVREEQTAYDDLTNGRADMLPFTLPASVAQQTGALSSVALRNGSLYQGAALVFNLRQAPFNSAVVRRAVAEALDLPAIANNAGPAVPARQGYIDPASPWSAGASLQRYDPAAARAGLAKLGSAPIQILTANNDPLEQAAGQQVAVALRRLGAAATVATVSADGLGRALGQDGSRPSFQAAIDTTSELASYDPDFLAAVFGSGAGAAPLNVSGYRSSAFNALAQQVASARSLSARRSATRAELRLLATDLPVVPLFFEEGKFAYRPGAYSRWVFIKGAGILDKRSFLAGQGASKPAPAAGTARPGGGGGGTGSGSGLSAVDVISLGVVAVVLVLAALALNARRTAGRR